MKHKSRYIIESIYSLKNKVYELAILTPLLCDSDLLIVLPYTQFPIETTDNRKNYIDLYYEDIKLGIEIYEPFHKYQIDTDEKRKKEIENKLDCEIIEVKIDSEFIITDEIANLKKKIIERINEEKSKGTFNEWISCFHKLTQVQEDYPNAICVNANNFNEGVHGPININESIIQNADLFVVYSGGTVYKVFQINQDCWTKCEDSSGYLQYGKELTKHPLISSGATDWNVTTNRVLGKNICNLSTYKKAPLKTHLQVDKKHLSPKGKFKKIIRKSTRKK